MTHKTHFDTKCIRISFNSRKGSVDKSFKEKSVNFMCVWVVNDQWINVCVNTYDFSWRDVVKIGIFYWGIFFFYCAASLILVPLSHTLLDRNLCFCTTVTVSFEDIHIQRHCYGWLEWRHIYCYGIVMRWREWRKRRGGGRRW